ncbi:MAG: cysteine desulfurase [Ignavibacteriales bacterium]|nr:cysteine desulfurase [Ignavibacteriales bacterium]
MKRVYLDHSATTPLAPEVFEAMRLFLTEAFGNASSIHGFGREAKRALEESRERIARHIGASFDEVYFNSGGTESDNHALTGVFLAARESGKNHVVISAIEHHAVLETAEHLKSLGARLTVLPVDRLGRVALAAAGKALDADTCLISVMHANNEVGTIQAIEEIGALARAKGILVHSDAVQSLGKLPIDVRSLPVDVLSFSAHKIYGPKGIGATYIRKGTKIESLLRGGAQESKRRAGTENVAGAVGFARAVELCYTILETESPRLGNLRQELLARIQKQFPDLVVNGDFTHSLPNILSVSFDSSLRKLDGDALIMGMDLRGVAVTSGSACTSGSLQASHVLLAMGRDMQTARATVRFSLGRSTTREEIAYAAEAFCDVVKSVEAAQR